MDNQNFSIGSIVNTDWVPSRNGDDDSTKFAPAKGMCFNISSPESGWRVAEVYYTPLFEETLKIAKILAGAPKMFRALKALEPLLNSDLNCLENWQDEIDMAMDALSSIE